METLNFNILVPISFICGLFITLGFSQYLSYRGRKQTLEVLETAVQSDAVNDHKALEAIAWAKPRPYADLRRATLFLAITISLWVFSFSLDPNDFRSLLQSLSIFPFTLGIAYLFFHFYTAPDQSSQQS